jgi:hypothetical protein
MSQREYRYQLSQDIKHFHHHKNSSYCPIISTPLIISPVSIILSFQKCYTNEIIQHVIFVEGRIREAKKKAGGVGKREDKTRKRKRRHSKKMEEERRHMKYLFSE